MKVLCINATGMTNQMPPLEEGKEYTVVNQCVHPLDGKAYYELAEIKRREPDALEWYWAKRFAPLSSIDEKEFVRNY